MIWAARQLMGLHLPNPCAAFAVLFITVAVWNRLDFRISKESGPVVGASAAGAKPAKASGPKGNQQWW